MDLTFLSHMAFWDVSFLCLWSRTMGWFSIIAMPLLLQVYASLPSFRVIVFLDNVSLENIAWNQPLETDLFSCRLEWEFLVGELFPCSEWLRARILGGRGWASRACVWSQFSRVRLWIAARQAPLSMGFSRQEHWSGLSFPSPRNLPDPGIDPASLMAPALAGRSLPLAPPWKPRAEAQPHPGLPGGGPPLCKKN